MAVLGGCIQERRSRRSGGEVHQTEDAAERNADQSEGNDHCTSQERKHLCTKTEMEDRKERRGYSRTHYSSEDAAHFLFKTISNIVQGSEQQKS